MNVRARLVSMLWICLCLIITLSQVGCTLALPSLPVLGSESGKIRLTNQLTESVVLSTQFDHSMYMVDDKDNLTILLVRGTYEEPQEALTIRMFWKPIPAQTPIDETATNATLHYVNFAKNQGASSCGVYSGAGFLYLYNNAGSKKLSAGIWQANLQLTDSTEGFKNNLGETVMTGKLVAIRNDEDFARILYQVNLAVNDTLGYPRFIKNELHNNKHFAAANQ